MLLYWVKEASRHGAAAFKRYPYHFRYSLDKIFILSQILASVAFVLGVLSFQFKERRNILLCWFGSALFNSFHFFILGKTGPAVLVFIAAIRYLVASYSTSRKLMFIFIILVIVGFFLSFKDNLSYIALFATLLATYAAFQKKDFSVRILMTSCTSLWVIHNWLAQTPIATLMEITFLLSSLIGFVRFYGITKPYK